MEAVCGIEGSGVICRFTNAGSTKASSCARLVYTNGTTKQEIKLPAVCSGTVEPGATSTIPVTGVPEQAIVALCTPEEGQPTPCKPSIEFTRDPKPEESGLDTIAIIEWAVAAFVLLTSLWVLFDARKLRFKETGPSTWFVGCLLLWIIVFPWYLIKRFQRVKQIDKDAGVTP
jgi:hypothetical protein